MKVFISYSTKDMDVVYQLRDVLKNNQIGCYLAEEDLQPGTSLWNKLERNIRNNDCVLAILTINGTRSDLVNQEIATAYNFNKPIIPLVEKGVILKGVLEGKEYIEFDRENPSKALENATNFLRRFKIKLENQQFFVGLLLTGLALWALSKKK